MQRPVLILLGFVLLLSACAEERPGASTPQVLSTTVPPTTAPPTTTMSTSSQPEPSSTTSLPSTTSSTTTLVPLGELELQLTEVARGFEQPVLALSPPADDRLFVVDQPGRIWVISGDASELFVDLTNDVIFDGERGLLGLAFHPDYATNGRLFVNYTGDRGATRVVELQAAADGSAADPASQRTILEIPQPARNHNGGMIAFGPDGHLWIGMGDGGGSNDEFDQGQRPDTLLGALLRIDVSSPGTYAVPEDNPFVSGGGAPEVWSYGLRNPWRFTFDGDTIYIADVGQNAREEINVLSLAASRGANFGWPIYEGSSCFRGPCDASGLEFPVAEYGHDEGCSITGGFVYRGRGLPELGGHYFYGDYCSGIIRSLDADGATFSWFGAGNRDITSFGRDAAGEIYVIVGGGSVYRVERGT